MDVTEKSILFAVVDIARKMYYSQWKSAKKISIYGERPAITQ